MTRISTAVVALSALCRMTSPTEAEEFQLNGTRIFGSEPAQAAALQSVDGILRIVNAFESANSSGEMAPILALANSVYAAHADVFRSQDFITETDMGGPAFLKALGFIHEVLGGGTEYLVPQQVCAIYAFQPDADAFAVDMAMATAAVVPQFGLVLNTVLVRTEVIGGIRQITYHEYLAAPAGGEDCTGPAAAAFSAEWLARVE
ncbi:hypothetical protein [Rhodophyticola sp.]|uniref:hypothetical protein n=1 Tax=Rhodophyticola sp. TaxID=2680032 RepID=UPI003D2DC5B3